MKKEMTLKEAGSLGGKARARNMTRGEMSRASRKAANARWAKHKQNG